MYIFDHINVILFMLIIDYKAFVIILNKEASKKLFYLNNFYFVSF